MAARVRAGEPLPPEVKRIAVVVVIGAIMSILDTTTVNVALQTLSEDLDAKLSTIQWVSTGYLLALATVIPLTGWLAERVGPKRVWMASVAAFITASALCGVAWSAQSLIAFRVLEGAAGGMIMPIGMITIAQAAGPERLGRLMSVVGVPMLLAPVFGPVLGGFLVENLSWRWIFFVNVPVGAIGLLLAFRLMPSMPARGRAAEAGHETPPLDVPGLLLLPPGVAAIVFGLSEIGVHHSASTPTAWVPIALGVLAVAAFAVHGWRAAHPLVDVRLFAGRGFSAAAMTTFLLGAALFGAMILLPLYFQVVRGDTALQAGLLMAPQGLGAAVAMNVAGRATDVFGGGRVVPIGLAILTLGTIPFAFIGPDTGYVWLMAALFVRGMGLGAAMMPAMAAAYATLRSAQVPRATPALNVLQRVGGSMGVAVLAVVLDRSLRSNLESAMGGAAGGGTSDLRAAGALPDALREQLGGPMADAFAHAYLWSLVGVAIALLPALWLMYEERKARRSGRGEGEADTRVPMTAG